MARHVMVEREFDDSEGRRMRMEESGLVSPDVWWSMVDALLTVRCEDVMIRHGFSRTPFSRGRHHAER